MATADLIRTRRRELNLTREQLAVAAGVSLPTIQRAETGTHAPTLATLTAIAEALSVPLSELIDLEAAS